MPPFRNFFPKRPTVAIETTSDENQPPAPVSAGSTEERRQRPSLTIARGRTEETHEYKLSVVDDSGAYLPPSPTERKGFWSRSSSRRGSHHRNLVNENEPFSISRESFDSYRRSFDISARSPISQSDTGASRTSLDSRFSRFTPSLTPHSTINGGSFNLDGPPTTEEEERFEEVRLGDDPKPKKRGFFFTRFGDNSAAADTPPSAENSRPSSSHRGFHLPGRKRAQSGQGAELGSMTVTPVANESN
ncbi:hypothetical protein AJ80_06043 [Polytolypa hystricis UAMH7299]|uniref:Uncharacterized protein n=1 Tax=Polytolypa hystricis (strain UAMH7299) TaxID=1447883 RepID=A0A2B7XQX8_POLH7|nr:hypothetical protein AJ80_06043 [Polytolypa hystricis UAMH7299]